MYSMICISEFGKLYREKQNPYERMQVQEKKKQNVLCASLRFYV